LASSSASVRWGIRPARVPQRGPRSRSASASTVRIPSISSLAAARPHAVAQDPQAALPMTTASTPLALTNPRAGEGEQARRVRLRRRDDAGRIVELEDHGRGS